MISAWNFKQLCEIPCEIIKKFRINWCTLTTKNLGFFFLRLRFKIKLIWKNLTDPCQDRLTQTFGTFLKHRNIFAIPYKLALHVISYSFPIFWHFAFFCFQIFLFTDFQKVGVLLIFKPLNWKSVKHQENYTLATLVL